MDTMIKEINSSLREIVDNLSEVKDASASVLAEVELKIGEKMDEAKLYKNEVEDNKKRIKGLDDEIADLENDLADLNERFGKKDLHTIVETGNREINNKISEKSQDIAKHRAKIGELTEKGRAIKELLNSLKKDKKVKEDRLDMLSKIFNYYNEQLSKIIEHSETNPDQLDAYAPSIKIYKDSENDESLEGVFDEIVTPEFEEDEIGDDTDDEVALTLDTVEIEGEEVEEETALDNIFDSVKDAPLELPHLEDNPFANLDENTEKNLEMEPELTFDSVEDSSLDAAGETLESLLQENGLDITAINNPDVITDFDFEKGQKILTILKDNKIEIENIYHSPNILMHPDPEELNKVITKLLLSDQTTANIGLIIGRLNYLKVKDLNDAIKSLGADIKSANIAELILSANKDFITLDINYITELGFNEEDVETMKSNLSTQVTEGMTAFSEIVKINFNSLNKFGANNIRDVFMNYAHMFLQNPDRFDAVLDKYDPADLVRCIEKNAAVIEKL